MGKNCDPHPLILTNRNLGVIINYVYFILPSFLQHFSFNIYRRQKRMFYLILYFLIIDIKNYVYDLRYVDLVQNKNIS